MLNVSIGSGLDCGQLLNVKMFINNKFKCYFIHHICVIRLLFQEKYLVKIFELYDSIYEKSGSSKKYEKICTYFFNNICILLGFVVYIVFPKCVDFLTIYLFKVFNFEANIEVFVLWNIIEKCCFYLNLKYWKVYWNQPLLTLRYVNTCTWIWSKLVENH